MLVHEFALLLAIATPAAVLFCMHAGLWASGERDILMVRALGGYPALEIEPEAVDVPSPLPTIPQNDEDFRLAA